MTNTVNAIVIFPGDKSAGLRPWSMQIDLQISFDDAEHREFVRNTLQKAFTDIYDGDLYVIFSDESEDYPAPPEALDPANNLKEC